MKLSKRVIALIVFSAITMFLTTLSFAEIPKAINYQGKLTNAAGSPVTDGTYSVTFNIYDVSSGGTPLWFETQSVSVSKGIFSTSIGATKDLSLAFDKAYWLGIKVGTDAEMTPRQKLTSAGYAFEAKHAADAAYAATAGTITDQSKLLPSGIIVMWSGVITSLPAGWVLCDGQNGTPDLRDRFIVGAGNLAVIGSKNTARITGTNNDLVIDSGSNNEMDGGGTCTGQHRNMIPDYYALAFIMKQ